MLFSEQKSDILKTEHGNGRKSLLYTCIRPGKTWYDTEGKRIQAHGGSVLWAENTFWWYGENKEGITGRATGAPCPHWHGGVRLYASHDLYNWKDEGVILIDRENRSGPFYPGNIMDRPHILFNEKSGTYLLWAKCSRGDFGNCFFAVAESKNIRGPYRAVREVSCAPHHAGDFDLFTDGNTAYIVYENPHTEMICRTLNDARNGFAEQVSSHLPRSGPPYTREAPAFFRHDGRNFLFTSGTTGYYPNRTETYELLSPHGRWKKLGDPCVNDVCKNSFHAQFSSVFRHPFREGLYIALGDRWLTDLPPDLPDMNGVFKTMFTPGAPFPYDLSLYSDENTSEADYVWLPVRFREDGTPYLAWVNNWRIEDF